MSLPQFAQAEFTAADAAMQERSQLYFKTYGTIADLLEATTAYSIARARDDEHAMHIAAAEMASVSSAAAFRSAVLNAEVQAEGSNAKAKELAPQLATLAAQVETKLHPTVANGDLMALNKMLDSEETASAPKDRI